MSTVTIEIERYDASQANARRRQRFDVPTEKGATVQQALMYIYENLDSSLAFRCGCRYRYCGLCALEVNDKPGLACLTPLSEGQVLKPLRHLPVLKDLIVDRSGVFDNMRDLRLYIPEMPFTDTPEPIVEPQQRKLLMQCTECLACTAFCPKYDYRDRSFGGPYTFVKLAQLYFDPRDKTDRVAQARMLGIERCADCIGCKCPLGVPAWEKATSVLLKQVQMCV